MVTRGSAAPEIVSPVIVLGMHGSGTSYLASAMAAWGIAMGAAPSAPPGSAAADRDFVDFHTDVVRRAVPAKLPLQDRDNAFVVADDRIVLTEAEQRRGRELVAGRDGDTSWGWTDPRTALVLDFWLDVLPECTLVAVYRHPIEVYGSLLRRHGCLVLDDSLALESWITYNEAILTAWARHKGPKVMLAAGDTLADRERLTTLLGGVLGAARADAPWPAFRAGEFARWPVSGAAHAAFAAMVPAAAAVFDRLQQSADAPFALPDGDAEPWHHFETLAASLSDDGRRLLVPALADALAPGFAGSRREHVEQMRADTMTHEARARSALTANRLRNWLLDVANQSRTAAGRPVCIWGAGEGGRRVLALFESIGGRVTCFVDSNPKRGGFEIDGVPIVGPRVLAESRAGGAFVIIASVHAEAIAETLQRTGRVAGVDFRAASYDEVVELESDRERDRP